MRTGDSPAEVIEAAFFSARLAVERILATLLAEGGMTKAAHVVCKHGDAVGCPARVYGCIAAAVFHVTVYKDQHGYGLGGR